MIGDIAHPRRLLDELKLRRRAVEIRPQHQAENKIHQGYGQRHPTGGIGDGFPAAARGQKKQRPGQRQKDDEAENVIEKEVHEPPPVTHSQVVRITTPASMANAY